MDTKEVGERDNFQVIPPQTTLTCSLTSADLFKVVVVILLLLEWRRRRFLLGVSSRQSTQVVTKLSELPGPPGLPLIGNAHQLWESKNRINVWNGWCKKFGGCFVFWAGPRPIVMLTSPDYIQKVLSSSDDAYLDKSFAYRVTAPLGKDGLLVSKVGKWRARRKLISRAFTYKSLVGYMTVYNKEGRSLVEELHDLFPKQFSPAPEAKGIAKLIWRVSLRVVCGSVLGTDVCDSNMEANFQDSISIAKTASMTRLVKPWLLPDWTFALHPLSRTVWKAAAELEEFTRGVMRRKIIRKNLSSSMVGQNPENSVGEKKQFTSMIEEMIDAGIDEEGIIEECQTMITGGYESAAVTLQFLLFFLALNQDHQDLCRKEVDEAFDDNTLCPDGDLTYEAVSNLKHLECCLMETLRIFPPGFLFMREIKKPVQLDDRITLPSNTSVAIFPFWLHNNPDVYPNPEVFQPERFLSDNIKTRHAYAYIPFSSGPRGCIGYKFAGLSLRSLTARVLRNFVIETTDRMEDIVLKPDLSLSSEPLNFVLTTRHNLNTNK